MLKEKINEEKLDDGYYHLLADLNLYPNAWAHICWSRRGGGKTYSALRYFTYSEIPFIYIKRTIEDVELLCSANKMGFDPSPFVPINRDFGTNIKAKPIKKGIGAFYKCDESDDPVGSPIGYILALSAVKKFKGFDFSIVDVMLLDEFIPQQGEIVRQAEGDMLLDLYMTIARDRIRRGRKPLMLVLFANAEEICTPITESFGIIDIMSDLNASGNAHYYDEDRGIHLHRIISDELAFNDEEDYIYRAFKDTAWGAKSFGGEFSNNDFSNVERRSLKNSIPYIKIDYKNIHAFIYLNQNDGSMYMTNSAGQKPLFSYDLNRENDQKRLHMEHGIELRLCLAEDKFRFKKYSYYDLIANYTKKFKI